MSTAIQSSSGAGRVIEVSATARRREMVRQPHGGEGLPAGARTNARHALVTALQDALASPTPAGATAAAAAGDGAASGPAVSAAERKHALHEFMHELFGALRPTGDAGEGRHGRGFAWGRTSPADLAQRLQALAQSLGGATSQAAPAEAPTDATLTDPAAEPLPQPSLDGAGAVAAVDTPLSSAFERLAAALNGGAAAADDAVSVSDRLAALLNQLARALHADPVADAPAAGGLVDLSA